MQIQTHILSGRCVADLLDLTPRERALANATPVLRGGDAFPAATVLKEFAARSKPLPAEICELVLSRIDEYEQLIRARRAT